MKYFLKCKKCGKVIGDFAAWFSQDQRCECGSGYVEVVYPDADYSKIKEIAQGEADSFYHYFDYLPLLRRDNIVSLGEGAIPMERWHHLEEAALQRGVSCQVYVYRNDLNGATGTFKDISASLAASVLKENGVADYCLASTGNAGVAFATYLAKAGIRFTEFAPSFIDPDSIRAIQQAGQRLVISKGGYGDAKSEAASFHEKQKVLISGGNTDPLRIESKKTIVFECLRQLGGLPTVYMQAVAGGTSPLAFEKGFNDLSSAFPTLQMPRMLLVQQDECDPMVSAWEKAQAHGFPQGWELDYQAKRDVHTRIGILTAANPGNYPLVAPLVRRSGGDFLRVSEASLPAFGCEMLRQRGILLGPASMVCYAGFYKALEKGCIHNGDRVLLNTGEGSQRAQWFVKECNTYVKL